MSSPLSRRYSIRGRCGSANRTVSCRRSTAPCRRFEYEIDNDLFVRVGRSGGRTPRGRADRRCPSPRRTRPSSSQGRSTARRRRSSRRSLPRAARSIWRSRSPTSSAVDIDFNTELQPGDRFALVVDKQFREDEEFSPATDRSSPLSSKTTAAGLRAVRFEPAGGAPAVFRRAWRVDAPLHAEVAAQVRSGRDVAASRAAACIPSWARTVRISASTTGRRPVRPSSRWPTASSCRAGSERRRRRMVHLRHANGFETEYLHLSVDYRARGRPRAARRCSSAASAPPGWPPVRTSTTASRRTACSSIR